MLTNIFPKNSQRRTFLRLIKEMLRDPKSLFTRINFKNLRTYREYRNHSFLCNVCGNFSTPNFDFPNIKIRREHCIGVLRETMGCKSCGSSMRIRTLAAKILDHINTSDDQNIQSISQLKRDQSFNKKILDTDNFSPISKALKGLQNYFTSSYLPSEDRVLIGDNYFNLDLEAIKLPNNSFDVVLTSDVMEHVRNIDKAHLEIARILADSGVYIFTIPYVTTYSKNRVLVEVDGDNDIFKEDPHYHGDPLTNNILAYRIFGRQVFQDLKAVGLDLKFELIQSSSNFIIDGDVFIASKGSV